jgi:hypothetical protein
MDETAIYDYSSVRICLNANIPIATFFFIDRWCKAKKPFLVRGGEYRSTSTPPWDPPFQKFA